MKLKRGVFLKKYMSIIISLLILTATLLSGCTEERTLSDEEKKLLGTWKGTSHLHDIMSFFKDGTCSHKLDLSGVWKIEGVELTIDTETEEIVYFYKLTENNTVLILTARGTKMPYFYTKQ